MNLSKVALVGAALWSAALVTAAFTIAVYSGEESTFSADGTLVSSSTSATLVDVNGPWAAVLAALPLTVTVVVAVLLVARGHRSARVTAWVAIGALGLLAIAGLLSVGLFFMPVVVALCIAVASATPVPCPQRAPRRHAQGQ